MLTPPYQTSLHVREELCHGCPSVRPFFPFIFCFLGDWPKLKGKAAQIRALAPFALHLAASHLSRQHVLLCQMLVRFYDIIAVGDRWLSEDDKKELKELGPRLVGLYSRFAAKAFADGERMWKLVPKFHLFQHLCEWQAQEWGNPRYFWTYSDEDMVGQMITVAESCHPRTMAVTALYKWLVVVFEEDA